MFAFFSVRCSGNDRSDILGCRWLFRDWRVPLCLHRNCPSDYRTVLTRPIYCRRDVEQAERQRHNGAERHNHTENVTQHRGSLRTPQQHNFSPPRQARSLIEINDGGLNCRRQLCPVFMWCLTLDIGAHHACWLLLQALFMTASVLTATRTTATRTMAKGLFMWPNRLFHRRGRAATKAR